MGKTERPSFPSDLCVLTRRMDEHLNFTAKFEALAAKLERLESRIDVSKNRDGWSRLSIVGLHEAVSSRSLPLRAFWSILLLFGIGFTALFVHATAMQYLDYRMATNVIFQKNASYQYPPMALCPDEWIDPEKIRRLGLSNSAVAYSLAYFDYTHTLGVGNLSAARDEFRELYTSRFTSLIDFYKAIAWDLDSSSSRDEFRDKREATIYSSPSTLEPIRKTFVSSMGICHTLSLADANGGVGIDWTGIYAKVRSSGDNQIYKPYPAWYLYYARDGHDGRDGRRPDAGVQQSYVFLDPGKYLLIKTAAKKYESLRRPGMMNCIDDDEALLDYSMSKCLTTCVNRRYTELVGCSLWVSDYDASHRLEEICNNVDMHGNETWMSYLFAPGMSRTHQEIQTSCAHECPERCHRTYFEVTSYPEYKLKDADYDDVADTVLYRNMSVMVMSMEHSAVLEGGIMTYVEVNTYSFIELVNNVGGTLGLFVGATIMNFVQVAEIVIGLVRKRWMDRSRGKV